MYEEIAVLGGPCRQTGNQRTQIYTTTAVIRDVLANNYKSTYQELFYNEHRHITLLHILYIQYRLSVYSARDPLSLSLL